MEPEKKLFLRIVIQLLEDYIADMPVATNADEGRLAKLQAKAWFLANSEDYQTVCDFANINPIILRKLVLNSKPPYKELQELIHEYSQSMRASTLQSIQEI